MNTISINFQTNSQRKLNFQAKPKLRPELRKIRAEMTSPDFWRDIRNAGQYLKGLHLADLREGNYVEHSRFVDDGYDLIGPIKAILNKEGRPIRFYREDGLVYEYDPVAKRLIQTITLDSEGNIECIEQYRYTPEGIYIKQYERAKNGWPEKVFEYKAD